jgi:hypothetical protein
MNNQNLTELSRILIYDPRSNMIAIQQPLIPVESQVVSHVRGKVMPEQISRSRFLAVHHDQVYVADAGQRKTIKN